MQCFHSPQVDVPASHLENFANTHTASQLAVGEGAPVARHELFQDTSKRISYVSLPAFLLVSEAEENVTLFAHAGKDTKRETRNKRQETREDKEKETRDRKQETREEKKIRKQKTARKKETREIQKQEPGREKGSHSCESLEFWTSELLPLSLVSCFLSLFRNLLVAVELS